MLDRVGEATASLPCTRVAIIVPARFESSRFPGKPLVPLRGADGAAKTLIERSWQAAKDVSGVTDVWIATDDPRIADAATAFGAATVLTDPACGNGTERCWDAVQKAGIDAEIVINLQGDAPLTPPLAIEALIDAMIEDSAIAVASAMTRCPPSTLLQLLADQAAGTVGATTVVCRGSGDALYFSKRIIPYVTSPSPEAPVFLHVGLYGYRRGSLARYARARPCLLEQVEGLEQLRFLDIGVPVRMVEITSPPGGLWEVNNPGDVMLVEAALRDRLLA